MTIASDASMAILTIHHWPDKEAGLQRDAPRNARSESSCLRSIRLRRPWLTDYLPELAALDEAQMPTMSDYERWLGTVQITPVFVPHDCSDGFLVCLLASACSLSRIHTSDPAKFVLLGYQQRRSWVAKSGGGILKRGAGSVPLRGIARP